MVEHIVFGDPHVHAYRAFDKNGSRLDYCLKALDNVFGYAYNRGITNIFCVGDWYDTQKILYTKVVNQSIELLQKWHRQAPQIKLYCITGNHDLASKNLFGQPYISGISHLADACPNFVCIDNSYVDIMGTRFYGIPYYDHKEHLSLAIDAISSHAQAYGGESVLLLHNTPSDLNAAHLYADFSINDMRFVNFKQIYCGHIHTAAIMADHFLLTGSLLHKSTEDIGMQKGFWHCDPCDSEGLTYRHIVDPTLPVFRYGELGESTIDYVIQKPKAHSTKQHDTESKTLLDKFKVAAAPLDFLTAYWEKEGAGKTELLDVIKIFI